ncbi:hypothetical protein D3C85_1370120 [compost metagenome]
MLGCSSDFDIFRRMAIAEADSTRYVDELARGVHRTGDLTGQFGNVLTQDVWRVDVALDVPEV